MVAGLFKKELTESEVSKHKEIPQIFFSGEAGYAILNPLASFYSLPADSPILVQLCFDFYMIEAKPENLIGDRAYDSDPLDEELRNDGIEMIAPHRNPIPKVTNSCSNCIIAF